MVDAFSSSKIREFLDLVADLLKISLPTVNRRTKKGILKAYKLKGDTEKTAVRFKKSEVLEMLIGFSYDTFK
mgnify:CR=1 FL=1